MKRPFCVFAALVLSFPFLFGQEILQQRSFSESNRVVNTLPVNDGYIVLGIRSREEKIGYEIFSYYRPFLAKLNGDFSTVWEQEFEESRYHQVSKVIAGPNGYYIWGHDSRKESDKFGHSRLILVSEQGTVLWTKYFKYPGYYSTESSDVAILPGGDLVLKARIFPGYSSIGKPWLLRVSPEGEIRWKLRPGQQYYYQGGNLSVTGDGNIALTGFAYHSSTHFKTELSDGWIYVVDPEDPNRVLVDKTYDDFKKFNVRKLMPLSDGGHWAVGSGRTHDQRSGFMVVMEFDPSWNLIRTKQIGQEDKTTFYPNDFCWDAARNQLVLAGHKYQPHTSNKEYLVRLSPDWEVLGYHTGPKGVFREIIPFSNGEYLVTTTDAVRIIR